MKKYITLALGVLAAATAWGQTVADTIPFANTIKIEPTDSHAEIIAKAAHVVPTPQQLDALEDEYIAFVHFGPNTFSGREWGTGFEDPTVFNPTGLDTDQWAKAMKDAGMTKVLLTVKHHDGYVIWQSRYTDHGIMNSPFEGGKGDVLRSLAESCHKYGLKLGIYLSPADLYQIENPEGLYGNLSPKTTRTIPRQVEGRPFANTTTFEFDGIDDYNEYFLNQLFELLTEYGPIYEVWFDGAHPKRKGGQTYNYAAWKKLIHTLAPEAVIFGREDIRWCGNEAGATRPTEWNVITYQANPDTMNVFYDMMDADLGSRDVLYKAKYLHYQPAETNTSIREGWFWRDDDKQKVRSADDVFDMYERAVGGNSILLLNIPPNRDGRFSEADVNSLVDAGRRIRETYENDLLAGATADKALRDNDIHTAVSAAQPIEIVLPAAVTINRVMLQEPVADSGERVEEHAVDAWIAGAWKEIANATNIGYKRILRFPDVTTDRLRIRVLSSRLEPSLSQVSAYYYKAHAPQLSVSEAADGVVTISPKKEAFGWNQYGANPAEALSAGTEIRYTTDGSVPTAASQLYTGPIALSPCVLKARAFLHGEEGPVVEKQIGYAPAEWSLVAVSSEAPEHAATLAFDANDATYWASDNQTDATITIDLGSKKQLNGFAYTPPVNDATGMIAKGVVEVSTNGKKWKKADTFEFGNLVNDPTTRYSYFKKPVTARYVRISAEDIAVEGTRAAIAEITLF